MNPEIAKGVNVNIGFAHEQATIDLRYRFIQASKPREQLVSSARMYPSSAPRNVGEVQTEHLYSIIDLVGDTRHSIVRFLANAAAKRHYIRHEGEYQMQAVYEAHEAGADIVGWPVDLE